VIENERIAGRVSKPWQANANHSTSARGGLPFGEWLRNRFTARREPRPPVDWAAPFDQEAPQADAKNPRL